MKSFNIVLAAALTFLVCKPASASLEAAGTITDSQIGPGEYQYDVTLSNTGTTTIGTFWFSWVPGLNFMSETPSDITTPAGWTDRITTGPGSAIQWVTASDLLAPGKSLTGFSFVSTETPAQLAGFAPSPNQSFPVTTSYVYGGAPFSDGGYQFVVSVASTPPVPEPATPWLMLSGIGGIAVLMRRRIAL